MWRSLVMETLSRARGVLLDLSGTLHVEDTAIPGAASALNRLRDSGLKLRFITNTTKESKSSLLSCLTNLGFVVHHDEVFTSLSAACQLVEREGLRPFLLLEESAMEDFQGLGGGGGGGGETERGGEGVGGERGGRGRGGGEADSVVVGLAPTKFDYNTLNTAFRILLEGGKLIAIHKARYYRRTDGLALGPGPFVAALEYASGQEAVVVGKPEPAFYQAALRELGCRAEETVMIGDDVLSDVDGAQKCGMMGVLVRTGKYRQRDDERISPPPVAVCEDFPAAVELILTSLHTHKQS